MNLIVLASGRGSRLRGETKTKPKCLTKIYQEKTILDFLSRNFSYFTKIIVVTGYRSKLIQNHLKNKKISFVRNINYMTTNMVESLMLARTEIENNEIIIVYGDIFFDSNIIKKVSKLKGNVLPLNLRWLKSWKKRYKNLKKIREDAEDLKVRKGKIISIGGKITKTFPKFQYMGIVKINKLTFHKLEKFYKTLNDKKISLTEFINLSIKSEVTDYKYIISKNYWYEVDNENDLRFLRSEIKQYI